MSRRSKPPNRHGCKPDGDVCVEHDLPLECNHGCYMADGHKCKFKDQPGWTSALSAETRAKLDEIKYGGDPRTYTDATPEAYAKTAKAIADA